MKPQAERDATIEAFRYYLTTPLDEWLNGDRETQAQADALALFHAIADPNGAEAVPAYRTLLAESGIDPASIGTFADLQTLPILTKSDYLRRFPLPDLCRRGRLETGDMIAVSSGSTGQPCFWPRSLADELAIAWRFEQIFRDSFQADTRRTLAVVCFALGTWVGGMYTAACCRHLAAKGYPVTVVTPGNNKGEFFRVVQELGPHFEQVVLLGYPPFLKDVVDTGRTQGVNWPAWNVKLVMAGEVFSEEWRTLVGERLGSTDFCRDSASLYGTADAGVLGNETPLSICIRRWLAERPKIAHDLFGESRLPTLVQYDPVSRYFEKRNGHLLFTGDNGVPLIRYDILDTGGIIGYDEMLSRLVEHGFDPVAELGGAGARGIRPLPFVYVFGRSDFTVSFFGANLFPENVTVGLEQSDIKAWVTGKFVLQAQENADRNAVLSIAVELAPNENATPERERLAADSIGTHLRRLNSEFAHYVPEERQTPRIMLRPCGDPEWFPVGVKHRYTRR